MNRVRRWILFQVAVGVASGAIAGPALGFWWLTRDHMGLAEWLTGGVALLVWGALIGAVTYVAHRKIYGHRRR